MSFNVGPAEGGDMNVSPTPDNEASEFSEKVQSVWASKVGEVQICMSPEDQEALSTKFGDSYQETARSFLHSKFLSAIAELPFGIDSIQIVSKEPTTEEATRLSDSSQPPPPGADLYMDWSPKNYVIKSTKEPSNFDKQFPKMVENVCASAKDCLSDVERADPGHPETREAFRKLLQSLGETRETIARADGSKTPHLFGKSRLFDSNDSLGRLHTPLQSTGTYKRCLTKAYTQFEEQFKQFEKKYLEENHEAPRDEVLSKFFSQEPKKVSVDSDDDLPVVIDYKYKSADKPCLDEAVDLYWEGGFSLYDGNAPHMIATAMKDKSYLYTTLEVEGQPLTVHVLEIPKEDPMNMACARATILHTSTGEPMNMIMGKAEDYFVQCVHDSKNEATLKKNLMMFRWCFAQATPYSRGSASIAEALEQGVAKAAGWEVSSPPLPEGKKWAADLPALILDPKAFATYYNLNTILTPTRSH